MAGHQWANTSHKSGTSSVKELSPNEVSMTNSTSLSNTFDDHFSTIGPNSGLQNTFKQWPQFSGI